MSLLEIGQKIIPNELDTSNLAKKNQANTFTTNQKIQGQLELRKNGNVLKVGNVDNNNSCYMELFNGNDRRAYIGHTSSNNNTFEINNGNNEIKLAGGSVNVNNKKITGLANPTSNSDATNKAYVDGLAQGAAKTNIANTFTTNQKIQGQLEIRKNDDAIKLGSTTNNGRCYIELFNENTSIGMIGKTNETNEFKIDVGGNHINLAGGLVKVNNKRITQVANPTENTDAVNKQYVDTKNTEQDNRITTLENKPSGGLTIYYDRILRIDTSNYNTESNLGELTIRQVLYTIKTDKYIVNMRGFGSSYFVVSFNLAYTSEYGDRYAICIARKTGTTLPDFIELNYDAVDYSRLTRQGEQ